MNVFVAIVACIATLLGILAMFVKVIRFTSHVEAKVDRILEETRRDRAVIRIVPVLAYKVEFLEKHLKLNVPGFAIEGSDD